MCFHLSLYLLLPVLREAKPLAGAVNQLPPLQPIAKYSASKTVSLKANGLVLPDSTTLTPLIDATTSPAVVPKKVFADEECIVKRNVASNSNNNSSSNNNNNISSASEEKKKLNQDLNRCLKETVDAIFSPNSPIMKDSVKDNSVEDEVTLIKVPVNPTKEEVTVKEELKKELPEDDVKIEIVKQPVKSEQVDVGTEDFDPMKVLEWKDGIGTLPGSNLKVFV